MGEFFGAVAALILFCVGFISAIDGEDILKWEKVDSKGQCYVNISQDRNIWFTPGETKPEKRIIYCKAEGVMVK